MMEAPFNDKQTSDILSQMQPFQQLAVGAACCERMLPNYELFVREANWGDPGPLRHALNKVWEACEGRPPQSAQLQLLLSECENCAPDSEDFTSLFTSSAQDAAFGVCALLDFLLDGKVECIVRVLRLSTDSVDLIVQEEEEMDPRDPLLEGKILEHPLMQQELARQRRDLVKVSSIIPSNRIALVTLRTQAQLESNLMLVP